MSLWYFVCYHIGHETCPLPAVPMVLHVLSHWTWNVSTAHCPSGTSCVITFDMKSVHCPLSLWYFMCYHIWHEKCPLPTVPLVLRVLSHWTWKVSTVHYSFDTSCVITLDMKRVHCPRSLWYFMCYHIGHEKYPLSLWYLVCYHIGHETCLLSAIPTILRVLSHWTRNVTTVLLVLRLLSHWTWNVSSVHCSLSHWYIVCYHIGHERCPLFTVPLVLRVLSHWTWNAYCVNCSLSLWIFPCYYIGHETCCSGATSRPSWCYHKIVFLILPGLITISWQIQLQRKTKSHLVFMECAGYISWQLFLFRLYILWQITTYCTLHRFTRFSSSALIL